MRKINEIILHCSATPEGRDVKMEEIRRWHLKRGFFDIGYHFLIELDGTIRAGRSIELTGAHCIGHNKNSIGICYVGGASAFCPPTKAPNPLPLRGKGVADAAKMIPADTRTPEQKKSLLWLIRNLMNEFNLGLDAVHCHNEYANKACPSFSRDTIINELTMQWYSDTFRTLKYKKNEQCKVLQ